MQTQPETAGAVARRPKTSEWRQSLREAALQRAVRKRAIGAATYTVPEAAALLSVSQEHLYRLIQAEKFPAVRVALGDGKRAVSADVVEELLRRGSAEAASEFPGGAA